MVDVSLFVSNPVPPMNDETSDPIAYIKSDSFSYHSSNPFNHPAGDASSDPVRLIPSKRESEGEEPRAQEEGDATGATVQWGSSLPSWLPVLQRAPPGAEQEENAELDETQDADQAMRGYYVEDDVMEDYDEPVGDHELSEGDFRERTSDEYLTLDLKSPSEQAEIEKEMEDLIRKVPSLADGYVLLDRLGTGVADPFYVTIPLHSIYLP